MPQNWKTYKIKDICDKVSVGFVGTISKFYTSKEDGIPILRSKNVKPGRLDFNDLEYITRAFHEKNKKSQLYVGDIAIVRVGENRGDVCKIPHGFDELNVANCVFLRPPKEYKDFLELLLRSPYGRHLLLSISTGSAQGVLNTTAIAELSIQLPAIEEASAIANIINSLDDKIELNLQMNKTLEEMAMTLYKQWFVDFEFPYSPPNSPPSEGWISSKMKDGVVNSPPPEGSAQQGVVSTQTQTRNTTNYMSLPYNPKLKDRAKALRKAGNLAEVLFWQQVHQKKFNGLDFDRQKIIGNYIVDFYCANVNVVVEIDGSSHDNKQEYDAARDAYLESLGLTVIHITDDAVLKDLPQTMEDLNNHPAFQAPLQGRGSRDVNSPPNSAPHSPPQEGSAQRGVVKNTYKSSGGRFIDSELGPIPEGWEVKSVRELVSDKIIMAPKDGNHGGIHPKGADFNSSEIPFVTASDLKTGEIDFANCSYISFKQAASLKKGFSFSGDILLSHKATIGRVCIVPELETDYVMLSPQVTYYRILDEERLSRAFLVYTFKSKRFQGDFDMRAQSGSTRAYLGITNQLDLNLLLPKKEMLSDFNVEVQRFMDSISSNNSENQTLTALRDTLLPKLISGEIRIKDAEQLVTEAL